MTLYIIVSARIDPPVDSVWDTLAAAQNRKNIIDKQYGQWRQLSSNDKNSHMWSEDCCNTNQCVCVADFCVIQEKTLNT